MQPGHVWLRRGSCLQSEGHQNANSHLLRYVQISGFPKCLAWVLCLKFSGISGPLSWQPAPPPQFGSLTTTLTVPHWSNLLSVISVPVCKEQLVDAEHQGSCCRVHHAFHCLLLPLFLAVGDQPLPTSTCPQSLSISALCHDVQGQLLL